MDLGSGQQDLWGKTRSREAQNQCVFSTRQLCCHHYIVVFQLGRRCGTEGFCATRDQDMAFSHRRGQTHR